MTVYIIKSIICSGILLMFYQLLLKKEKMHHFNRFYLIGSIAFSLLIPLVSIELPQQQVIQESFLPEFQNVTPSVLSEQEPDRIPVESVAKNFDPKEVIIAVYALISLVLLIRFARNIGVIFRKKSGMQVLDYHQAKLVLVPEDVVTYTFLKYIFVNEKAFRNGHVETEILTHELAHVKQKHTLDILLIELVNAVFWINPVLLFYRNAIRLNHEFLADNAVLNEFQNIKSYQLLLLDKVLYTRQITLTSSFNYSITKNRLEMMTKAYNRRNTIAKIILLLPVVVVLTYGFITKVEAQSPARKTLEQAKTALPKDGVSQKHFDEYETILKSLVTKRKMKNGTIATYYDMTNNSLVKKLDVIYRQMSDKQRAVATKVQFIPMLPTPQSTPPTQELLNSWLDSKKFGVWLNDKRIKNEELKKYKPSDFAYYDVSKLEKNAINYGKHYFQIGLMTPDKFENFRSRYVPLSVIPD